MKRISELRSMSDEQLRDRIREDRDSFMRMQMYNKSGGAIPSDPNMMGKLRVDKARCLTILSERERARRQPE